MGAFIEESGSAAAWLPAEFLSAAKRYWLRVFPTVRREAIRWRSRAEEIPDPVLRQAALANLRAERLNLDGAAAFAAFAPDAHRPAVVRAQVALQAAYDYVDALAEQPCRDPIRNGDQLHKVLGAALDPTGPRIDYTRTIPNRMTLVICSASSIPATPLCASFPPTPRWRRRCSEPLGEWCPIKA